MDSINPIYPTRPIALSSPIEEKIAWARAWYEAFGTELLADQWVGDLLNRLRDAVAASRREMAQAGISEICRRCDQEEGGSCCGAGIENRYDGWLLLIQLLLGGDLPGERRRTDACYFWGDQGCSLIARHVLCINYLCKTVTDRVEPERIAALREREGDETHILFLLHERIKTVWHRWISDSEKPSPP